VSVQRQLSHRGQEPDRSGQATDCSDLRTVYSAETRLSDHTKACVVARCLPLLPLQQARDVDGMRDSVRKRA
jgi:hypothetical protein